MRAICLGAAMAALAPCALFAQTTNPSAASSLDPFAILSSPDPSISQDWRDLAAIKLIAARDPSTVPKLVNYLNNGPPAARIAVMKALGSIGWGRAEFVNSLTTILLARDAASTFAAALALMHYPDSPGVLDQVISQAESDRPAEERAPIVRALGASSEQRAAKALVNLLQNDPDEQVRSAAGDALIEMTGLESNDHSARQWVQWFAMISNLSDADASAAIMHTRAEAYESRLNSNKELQTAANELLENQFWASAAVDRSGILLSYLRSPAPEIRALGARLVEDSAAANGAPPGTFQEARTLLSDPSWQVRAAAARALSYDFNSAPDLAAQLSRETDDFVRVQMIESVAQFQNRRAIEEMLKLLSPDQSLSVRLAAADGIRQGGPLIIRDPDLKNRTIDVLKAALAATETPGAPGLRPAIVGALAAMQDNSLAQLFLQLVAPTEQLGVRENALRGLGNLPDPTQGDSEIARNFDDPDEGLRLAAVQAIEHRSSPPSWPIMSEVLRLSNEDASPAVKAEAWNDLRSWIELPAIEEADLTELADGLKKAQKPDRELPVLEKLRDRLVQDGQNVPNGPQRQQIYQQVAEQQQNIGDLLADAPINQQAEAAGQYQLAFDFWQANNGTPSVIDALADDITKSLLSAKRWDDAAKFASGVIRDFGSKPQFAFTAQTVAREFVIAAQRLVDSNDPNAFTDATALFAAVGQMNPPLPGDIQEQLNSRQTMIREKHAAPATSP